MRSPDTIERAVVRPLPVLRAAMGTGRADLAARYTWWTWGLGWVLRGALEVSFFAFLGILLERPDITRDLLIGRGIFLGALEMMLVVQTVGWERQGGTLPLLMMAPTRVWPAFVGRACQWVPSAIITPLVVLLVVGPVFGLSFTGPQVAGLAGAVVVTSLASLGFSLVVAAVVLRAPDTRNLVSSVVQVAVALLCGVFVPISYWPAAVQAVAQVVPLTHTIEAVRRSMVGEGTWAEVVAASSGPLLVAAGLGAVWLVLGCLLIERYAHAGRDDGRIDLDE
ncbi:ABC transporter permease [Cellulomonas sp. Leaf334]|uniref:ABC transporter permease n=1 Tax=Cellulomonas sp. Leaf334 TaxID=1736339 RepID=UPI0006FEC3BD|nr:ABC transporter permease [Cellulomonas sp. Leaf334]KQR11675.1 hypothetical protein ASF78_10545 [Cellulomonas sp. Leaf334]